MNLNILYRYAVQYRHTPEKQRILAEFISTYHQASPGLNVTDGIVMWAAAVMVITAGCSLKWTASPCKAIVAILKDAAASVALRAGIIIVTHSWGLYW